MSAPRRSRRPRVMLVGGLCALGLAALGWVLLAPHTTAVVPTPSLATGTTTAPAVAHATTDTATLLDARDDRAAAVTNPFDGPSDKPAETSETGDASAHNPFRTLEPAAQEVAHPVATRAVAKAKRQATPVTAARAAHEPDLLQALMDNIRQPAEPARDTRAMDRLTRRLDRDPMPATTKARAQAHESPAAPATASDTTSLRAELDRCPAGNNLSGRWCRRRACKRAGVDPWACKQH